MLTVKIYSIYVFFFKILAEYYIIIMVLIAVSTAMNVAVLNIFHRHQDKQEVHEVKYSNWKIRLTLLMTLNVGGRTWLLPCDCSYYLFWNKASYEINVVKQVENIRLSSGMKLAKLCDVKSSCDPVTWISCTASVMMVFNDMRAPLLQW